MNEKTVTMRYRMSDRDVFYGGGVVNGARSITYMGDVATRLMAKVYGNTSRCSKVKKIRFFIPCFAGDYMEFKARILEEVENKVTIEVRSFKVAVLPEQPEFPSSIDMIEEPPMSTAILLEYEIPKKEETDIQKETLKLQKKMLKLQKKTLKLQKQMSF